MKFQLKNIQSLQTFKTLDLHTEGEPLRIITHGYPEIVGDTILEKRRYVEEHLDHLRKVLMFEPRGHADMYGALITEPCTTDGDFGILFMHNDGYSSMCGHGIIATITAGVMCDDIALEENKRKTIKIDSPAGRINAYAQRESNKLNVSFDCVPSFVEALGLSVNIEGFGDIEYDIAFGGAYYAYVDADKLGIKCTQDNVEQLIDLGRKIKSAVINNVQLTHPEHQDLSFLYGTIFTSTDTKSNLNHSKHVCIFANGEVDRSPTGTGVSGRIALLHSKGLVKLHQLITIESIISSSMTTYAHSPTNYYGFKAIIPNVSGSSFITGEHDFSIDTRDPLKHGFILR